RKSTRATPTRLREADCNRPLFANRFLCIFDNISQTTSNPDLIQHERLDVGDLQYNTEAGAADFIQYFGIQQLHQPPHRRLTRFDVDLPARKSEQLFGHLNNSNSRRVNDLS